MPDDPVGALPWAWARGRLGRCRNYWVVTSTPTGRPHAMPVWGVWIDEPAGFFFSASPNSRKARNLARNAQMTVAADDTVEVVSVEGVAAPAGADAAAGFAARYAAKYAPSEEQAAMAAFVLSQATWLMRPERAFGIIEREEEFATKATRWVW